MVRRDRISLNDFWLVARNLFIVDDDLHCFLQSLSNIKLLSSSVHFGSDDNMKSQNLLVRLRQMIRSENGRERSISLS